MIRLIVRNNFRIRETNQQINNNDNNNNNNNNNNTKSNNIASGL